ncbi:hypothetical protein [Methanopyrus kandleri]|jgi:hypothetical protein|uniref:Predicted DNA-binding protein n=2 Tax=Methanopyrus kandleri TaxID=2320 RepID=F1SVK3_METKA|nr:hypothetical protein [Methanopyrus kandleri]AAK72560.1 DNA-binding protein [Methanopyrus kandleri]AAM02077.1 Predicted DNA-binding protein [Methanopyrus kandleri AV19]HII69908.1 hypothetical protein [Methanopyrus kandleri]
MARKARVTLTLSEDALARVLATKDALEGDSISATVGKLVKFGFAYLREKFPELFEGINLEEYREKARERWFDSGSSRS